MSVITRNLYRRLDFMNPTQVSSVCIIANIANELSDIAERSDHLPYRENSYNDPDLRYRSVYQETEGCRTNENEMQRF